jgi:uncharacterized membrane protein YgcG
MASNIVIDIAAEFTGKKAFNQTEKAIDKLGKRLKSALIGGSILALTNQAIKAFAEGEKSAALLANSLENLGFGMATKSVEAFIGQLQLATGVSDTELRPAMSRLVQTLGSVALAQDALTLAMDVSAASGINLDTVVSDIAQAYAGNLKGLKKYNLGLTALELKTMSVSDIMAKFNDIFGGGAAVAADTFAGKLARITTALDKAKGDLGKGIIDALIVATGSQDIEALQQKIIDFGKYAGESIVRLGQIVNDFLPVIKTVGAAFAALFIVGKIQAGVNAIIRIMGGLTKAMKALRVVALTTAIAQAFVLNPLGGVAVAAGIIGIIAAVGVAVDGLDAKYLALGKKQKDFLEGTNGLKFGQRFDLTEYKALLAEEKRQAELDKKNADALKKAEAAAAAARAKQAKLELAAKQKSDKLAKASAMFDLDKIQVAAALKGKITDEEKLRLQLQQAILNENDELADKLQQKLEASQRATAKLTADIIGIKPGVNPFDAWLNKLDEIAAALGMIAGVTFNPSQSKDRNYDQKSGAAGGGAAGGGAGGGGGGGGGGGTSGSVPTEVIPPAPYVGSSFYDLENMFPVITKTSSAASSAPSITVNVNAGSVIMQDDLITVINDGIIAAQKNGYTQLPNGAIVT